MTILPPMLFALTATNRAKKENVTGLTWDQAIDQRPQGVQSVLAASWH